MPKRLVSRFKVTDFLLLSLLTLAELAIIFFWIPSIIDGSQTSSVSAVSSFATMLWLSSSVITLLLLFKLKRFVTKKPSWKFLRKIAFPLVIAETFIESGVQTMTRTADRESCLNILSSEVIYVNLLSPIWEELGRLGLVLISPLYILHDFIFVLSHGSQPVHILMLRLLYSILLSGVVVKTKNLWNAVLIHLLINLWIFGVWVNYSFMYGWITFAIGSVILLYVIVKVWMETYTEGVSYGD